MKTYFPINLKLTHFIFLLVSFFALISIPFCQSEGASAYNKNHRKKILYLAMGDSITSGLFASTKDKAYPKVLSKYFAQKLGYPVASKTVGGPFNMADTGVKQLPKVLADKPQIVSLQYGSNEANPILHGNPKELRNSLETIIKKLQNSPSHPYIFLFKVWRNDTTGKYDRVITSVGHKHDLPVISLKKIYADRQVSSGPVGRHTFAGPADNWHPNNIAMKTIAQAAYKKTSGKVNHLFGYHKPRLYSRLMPKLFRELWKFHTFAEGSS